MKLLFIHNTVPEYRVEFMKSLTSLIETEFFITDKFLQSKIYGMNIDKEILGLRVDYLNESKRRISIKSKIKESGCDIVILPPADNIKEYINGIYSLIYSRKYKKKCIYWGEKWEAEINKQPLKKRIKNLIHRIIIGSLARNVDTCIASGSKSKEYFIKIGVKSKNIKIAYDSSTSPKVIDKINLRKKYGLSNNANIILYLGRLVKRKGPDLIIQAFNNIMDELKDTYLIVCGTGEYEEECKKLAEEYKNERIIFTGKIDSTIRSLYYSQSNVFVLPSYSEEGVIEAWGLTVNEAMEYGLPVVATSAVGAAYDLIENGYNGYVVEENNINALEEGILKVIKNDNNNLFEANCKATATKYSVYNMAKEFFIIISNLK